MPHPALARASATRTEDPPQSGVLRRWSSNGPTYGLIVVRTPFAYAEPGADWRRARLWPPGDCFWRKAALRLALSGRLPLVPSISAGDTGPRLPLVSDQQKSREPKPGLMRIGRGRIAGG